MIMELFNFVVKEQLLVPFPLDFISDLFLVFALHLSQALAQVFASNIYIYIYIYMYMYSYVYIYRICSCGV